MTIEDTIEVPTARRFALVQAEGENCFHYGPYRVFYRGVMTHYARDREGDIADPLQRDGDRSLAAQWIAYPMWGSGSGPHRYFYSSYPGNAAEYQRGAVFDTDPRPGQEFIASPDDPRLDEYRSDALNRMLDVLDREIGPEREYPLIAPEP